MTVLPLIVLSRTVSVPLVVCTRPPPECPEPKFGPNEAGQHTATAVFKDPGGIDRIDVIDWVNVSVSFSNYFQG